MRDRDRILHSKPFRRLKHKTQVFVEPKGDHYRTRLTHTLEVAQIARTIGRGLALNEDLIEAIALGHDVGHTPFGHAGEAALDEALRESGSGKPSGFRHDVQSLRVWTVLVDENLTAEVRDGIGGHSKGEADLKTGEGHGLSTLEATVVRIADRIAYMNHDLDDAVRAGMVERLPERFASLGASHGRRITAMVNDVICSSIEKPEITISAPMLEVMNELKDWLFENVYERYPELYPEVRQAQNIVKSLYQHYMEEDDLPEGFSGRQGVVDYIAGMTDRFAIAEYERIFIPRGFEQRIRSIP